MSGELLLLQDWLEPAILGPDLSELVAKEGHRATFGQDLHLLEERGETNGADGTAAAFQTVRHSFTRGGVSSGAGMLQNGELRRRVGQHLINQLTYKCGIALSCFHPPRREGSGIEGTFHGGYPLLNRERATEPYSTLIM